MKKIILLLSFYVIVFSGCTRIGGYGDKHKVGVPSGKMRSERSGDRYYFNDKAPLISNWNLKPDWCCQQLRDYLGPINEIPYKKLRIVMNYLTGSTFNTWKIKHPCIVKLQEEISYEMKKRKIQGKISAEMKKRKLQK